MAYIVLTGIAAVGVICMMVGLYTGEPVTIGGAIVALLGGVGGLALKAMTGD
ncbi:MAG: hypothetical protein OXF79_21030 [Chloroflexi bacterium]|nr:hypothetical protein [Chloroflexota bacterium]